MRLLACSTKRFSQQPELLFLTHAMITHKIGLVNQTFLGSSVMVGTKVTNTFFSLSGVILIQLQKTIQMKAPKERQSSLPKSSNEKRSQTSPVISLLIDSTKQLRDISITLSWLKKVSAGNLQG